VPIVRTASRTPQRCSIKAATAARPHSAKGNPYQPVDEIGLG
jgi:hypothetical protein